MSSMIEVRRFKKTFYVGVRRKRAEAVRDISFSVEKGEIFGFLGPNGAGKTTTIKALLGLIRPDAGELNVLGHPAASMGWRGRVGYLPEHPTFYEYLTGLELVVWFAKLTGLSQAEAESQAKTHLARVGLSHAMDKRLRTYSKGMLQRAGLAQALVGSPELLILDEPMTGLDPIGRKDIRELILELRDEGRTIFYSTHILPDVEMTCDRVAIVAKGALQKTGRLEDILRETTRGISVAVAGLSPDVRAQVLAANPGSTATEDVVQVEFKEIATAQAFLTDALSRGAKLVKFEPHKEDLEAIFVRSLGGDLEEMRRRNI